MTKIICVSGRLSATMAVLLADHDCMPTGSNSLDSPAGSVKVVTGGDLRKLQKLDPDLKVWIHKETFPDRDLLDFVRSWFKVENISNI